MYQKTESSSWETLHSDKSGKDINIKTLRSYVTKANKAKRIDFRYSGVISTLNKLGLIKDNKLLKAAEVLFIDNNSLELQAAVFAGNNKVTFLDIRQFKGNLFKLLELSETYIKEHINWRAKLEGREREEIPEIPLRAITEALVNSLCHRDFANPKGNEVAVFKDRIEIYNPGQFPRDYSPRDFFSGKERSVLRNPLIANTLYLSKDIERWGSGIKRIHDACLEENVKVSFDKLKSGFLVTFYRKGITPQVQPESQPESKPESLNIRILHLLGQYPLGKAALSGKLGQKEISGHLNKTIRELLSGLFIELTLPGKPNSRFQQYRLTKKGADYLKKQNKNDG